jgi:hypothetical protein
MEPSEVDELRLGSQVWVWVVRLGDGRWWPATVKEIDNRYGAPLVTVSFESFARSRHSKSAPVIVGHIVAPMRRLERRDASAKGSDRPHFVPVSRLRQPELPAALANSRDSERPSEGAGKSTSANGELAMRRRILAIHR